MKPIRIALLSGVLLMSGGCFQKKQPVIAPVPPAPKPVAVPTPAPPPQQTAPAPAQPAPVAPPAEPEKPSPFGPATTAPVRPVTPTPVKPTPAPAPALGAILPPDQRAKLETAYQSDLRQANLTLGKLSGRSLTPEQLDSVSRARAFIRQAAQYHNRDLATAAELARRARVLTQDLAGTLK